MPVCYRCHRCQVSKESDLCESCEADLIDQAEEQQERETVALKDYSGDQYLVDGWLADDLPFNEAKGIVEDPSYISMLIELGELADVLADKYATSVLRKSLMDRNPQVLKALSRYVGRQKVRGKPGRKPKGPEKLFDYQRVYDLRKTCLTFGQIAQRLWRDSSKSKHASALYHRALKRGLPPIDSDRKQPSTALEADNIYPA